jgi:hypothetical protein
MRRRTRATHVRKQGLGRNRELRTRNFVRGGFIAGVRFVVFDNDQLRLGPSGDSQMPQDFDAVFIRPIMENLGEEENCDVFLPRWLRVKETEALRNPNISDRLCERRGWNETDPVASRGQSPVRRACSVSNTALKTHQKEVHMESESMRIAPHWHRRERPRDLV